MKRKFLLIIAMLMAFAAASFAEGAGPGADRPYRLKLRVRDHELADLTMKARVRINLGPQAAKNAADVLVLDDKGREQPWKLMSARPTGDVDILFHTVKGVRDYTLVFGKPAQTKRPDYKWDWKLGRVIIDDALPSGAYIHGLWSWVTRPVLRGAYAHANPVTNRVSYHGTSHISNQRLLKPYSVPLSETGTISQFVMLDKDNPPQQIVLRLVFDRKRNANSWDTKRHVNLFWGKRKIKILMGRSIKMGELPSAGSWHRLTVPMQKVFSQGNIFWPRGEVPELFGVEFCTDKGRAYWDMTVVHPLRSSQRNDPIDAAEVDVVSLGILPGAPAGPTIAYQRLNTFKLSRAGKDAVLNKVRFFPSIAGGAAAKWDFGDGHASSDIQPVHVFEGTTASRKVRLETVEPGKDTTLAEIEISGLGACDRVLALAIEMVSCPFIVRTDGKALFNLRLEGEVDRAMPVEMTAELRGLSGRTLRTESADIVMLPGEKHPTFKAFSIDIPEKDLARVRFSAKLHGRLLAEHTVTFRSSGSDLRHLKLRGDRFVDRNGRETVIRCEVHEAETGRLRSPRGKIPRRILIVGGIDLPGDPLSDRLRKAVDSIFRARGEAGRKTVVKTIGVDKRPRWSLPFRQVVAISKEDIRSATELVIIASATDMMLAGVSARTGADAIAVMVDQVRRRSDAQIVIVTPSVYSGLKDLSRQYAVALRMLGIEKNVPVIDLYSRSIRIGNRHPDRLETSHIEQGVLTHRLHPSIADEVVEAIVEELKSR